MMWGAVFVAGVGGFAFGVWMNQPTPPWIEFESIAATYEAGSEKVVVTGVYTARKTCSREEQNTPDTAADPLNWAQRVEGTGPEIVNYAPRPGPPDLKVGTHPFEQEIPLTGGILPDGWRVQVTVSCAQEPFAIRSRSVKVLYLPPPDSRAPDQGYLRIDGLQYAHVTDCEGAVSTIPL